MKILRNEEKVMGLHWGLEVVCNTNIQNLIIEGDSSLVIMAIKGVN
jgi:hypothetical protein